MDVAAANACATIAFCLLVLYGLLELIEATTTGPGRVDLCQQHHKPRHECRDQHR